MNNINDISDGRTGSCNKHHFRFSDYYLTIYRMGLRCSTCRKVFAISKGESIIIVLSVSIFILMELVLTIPLIEEYFDYLKGLDIAVLKALGGFFFFIPYFIPAYFVHRKLVSTIVKKKYDIN